MDNLGESLEIGISIFNQLENVKLSLIRQGERTGLIKSRLTGSRKSEGDAILFLDSHIEATENYLPPLKNVISKDYR